MSKHNEIFGSDSLHEECGVFGIYDMGDNLDVARLTYYGLYALQHRGQESCGIAVNNIDEDGKIQILQYKDMGLVQEVFNSFVLNELQGCASVGHVRYTTAGSSSRENAQPGAGSHHHRWLRLRNSRTGRPAVRSPGGRPFGGLHRSQGRSLLAHHQGI